MHASGSASATDFGIYSSVNQPPYVVRIFFRDRAVLNPLIDRGFDIFETSTSSYVHAQVTQEQYQYLIDHGYQFQKVSGVQIGLQSFPPYYKTYEQIRDELHTVASQFPSITEVFSIGDSWETKNGNADRKLWAIRVTNKAVTETKPKILYVGGHHAREVATPIVLLRFLHLLTDNYGKDAQITWLVDHRNIVILPLLNPDGYLKVEAGASWRKNTDTANGGCPGGSAGNTYGVDLNRNYSYQWGQGGASTNPCVATYQGPSSFSEPETQALRDFVTQEKFDFLLTYHSFGRMLLYPWGYTTQGTADDAAFRATAAKFTQANHYTTGQGPAILYKTTGDTTDWVYGTFRVPAFTWEISRGTLNGSTSGFFPDQAELEDIWNDNRDPMLLGASLTDHPLVHGLGPEVKTATVSGTTITVVTKTAVQTAEYFIDTKGADGSGTALSGSGTSFTASISGSLGRYLVVSAKDAQGWGPPLVVFSSSSPTSTPTPTPSPTGFVPTPTLTPTPQLSSTPTPTPIAAYCCPVSYPCTGRANFPSYLKNHADNVKKIEHFSSGNCIQIPVAGMVIDTKEYADTQCTTVQTIPVECATTVPTATPTVVPPTPTSTGTVGGCPNECSAGVPKRSEGNANCDNVIDERDYIQWRAQLQVYQSGSTIDKAYRTADFYCSLSDPTTQIVDMIDFEYWRSHAYPLPATPPPTPSPTSIQLTLTPTPTSKQVATPTPTLSYPTITPTVSIVATPTPCPLPYKCTLQNACTSQNRQPFLCGEGYVCCANVPTPTRSPSLTPNPSFSFAGKFNQSKEMPQYAIIHNSEQVKLTTQMTIEGWFKLANTISGAISSYQTLFVRRDFPMSKIIYWVFVAGDGKLRFGSCASLDGACLDHEGVKGTTVVSANQWHHIALVISGSSVRLFLDGQRDLSTQQQLPADSIEPTHDTTIFLGVYCVFTGCGQSQYYRLDGAIDDFRISPVVRYTDNFTPPTHPFVSDEQTNALFHFDEGSGSVLHDATGWANSAGLAGGAGFVEH